MDTQRLKDLLEKDGTFAIVVGSNYGVDEMASALSLYLALTANARNVSVVATKAPSVEVSNLVGIDKVKTSFESSTGDLIVSFPYRDDEIGKVSYTLESGTLNIIVKPKADSLSFSEKDVIFKHAGDAPAVLITVGVKRLSDLQSLFDVQGLKDTTIINLDKGQGNEGFGDVVITSQAASSISEQVVNLFLTLAYPMDPDISQNLMSGIISSTSNFQSPKTSSLAFEMAGILMRSGARRESLPVNTQPMSTQNARIFAQTRPTQPFIGGAQAQMPKQQQQFTPTQPRQNPQFGQNPQFAPQRNPNQQQRPTTEFTREQKANPAEAGDDTPSDWLAPKIFKGSTNVE